MGTHLSEEKKVVWFVDGDSDMPAMLALVQTKDEADDSIPAVVIDLATAEFSAENMASEEPQSVRITRTFLTDRRVAEIPEL